MRQSDQPEISEQTGRMMLELYEKRYPIFEEFQKATVRPVIEEANKRREHIDSVLQVLEIGTGIGATTLELSHHYIRVISVDSDPTRLQIADERLNELHRQNTLYQFHEQQRHYAQHSGKSIDTIIFDPNRFPKNYRLIQSDALDFLNSNPSDFFGNKGRRFDAVVSCYTFHNFNEDYRRQVLKECHDVLTPGGLLVIGDSYALDDPYEHARASVWTIDQFVKIYKDHPETAWSWILHKADDEKPGIKWKTSQATYDIRKVGFEDPEIVYRAKDPETGKNLIESVIMARKPNNGDRKK